MVASIDLSPFSSDGNGLFCCLQIPLCTPKHQIMIRIIGYSLSPDYDQANDVKIMAIPKVQNRFDETQRILMSFAKAQLSFVDSDSIKKNSFQFFAISAFLYGAVQQLGKQSTLPNQLVNQYLCNVLCDAFKLPQHNGEGLVSSIGRMMEKYYLLENIYREGEAAAEGWLTNDEADCMELKELLDNYREFTMMDMNAAGMKSNIPEFKARYAPEVASKKSSSGSKFALTIILAGAMLAAVYFYLGQNLN